MIEPRKRVLLIGAGRRIQNNFLPALRWLEGTFEVAGIHARNAERLVPVAEKWGANPVNSLAAIDFSEIDVAVISVPTAQNAPVLQQLLPHAAKLQLVIDTPIAWNFAEYAAAAPLFEAFAGVTVTEDYMNFPGFALLRKVVREGLVGAPQHLVLNNIGYLYHGLALIRSFTGFGPVLKTERLPFGSNGVAVTYHLEDGFAGSVIGPYRQHSTGGFSFEGATGIVTEFAADQKFYGGGKPLYLLNHVRDAGRLRMVAITGNGQHYELALPELAAMAAMDFPDKSEANLLRGCSLIEVFRSIFHVHNLNRLYGAKNAFYDGFVSRRAEAGTSPLDPFGSFGETPAALTLRASETTFIKSNAGPAASLPATAKHAARPGDLLTGLPGPVEQGHLTLREAALNGAPLGLPVSFAYAAHWH